MKTKKILSCSALAIGLLLSSCAKKEMSETIGQTVTNLNMEMKKTALNSAMLLNDFSATLSGDTMSVNIVLDDTTFIAPTELTPALAQYLTGQYLKNHQSQGEVDFLNEFAKAEGTLLLTLSYEDKSETIDIAAERLRSLLSLKQSQINYGEARTAVLDILAKRGNAIAGNDGVVDFAYASSMAQYSWSDTWNPTIANQGQLLARYNLVLNERYAKAGACGTFIKQILESFQIDGYRFVLLDKNGKAKIKASVPLNSITTTSTIEELK